MVILAMTEQAGGWLFSIWVPVNLPIDVPRGYLQTRN